MHKQQPVVATYKIFLFAGFSCAAIITSLFVYRINHQDKRVALNTEMPWSCRGNAILNLSI